MKIVYHGWIVIQQNPGYTDSFYVEYLENDVKRRVSMGNSPVPAIEFFDNRVGKPVLLLQTPLGAYRVYTEES